MKKTYSKANKRFFTSISAAILIGAFTMPAYAQEVDDEPVVASVEKIAKDQIALPQLSEEDKAKLLSSLNTPYRIDKARDKYRHPLETLEFFGIKPGDKVVEIWPGQGWYSSILAPYLKNNNGQLIAAHFDTSTTNSPLVKSMVDDFAKKFANSPETYGDVKIVPFGPRSKDLVEPNSVDAIVTFRNIHNWMSQGWADKAFDDFYKALKPGGLLGIEEHRADEDSPQDPLAADGYVREDYVIDMAKDAGFVLVGKSQINSNSKDTKDYPFGVWTLPPVGRTAPLGKPDNPDFDKTKYTAIGESDRMTLLFAKPLNPPIMVASASEKATKGKFNPVKVVFNAVKSKTNAKNTKTSSALPTSDTDKIVQPTNDSIKIAASDTTTKINDANNQIKPVENKEVKTETKIAQNTIPVPVPVKVDLKPTIDTKTEIKPTQEAIEAKNEPKPEIELPEFSVPDWNGNTKEKTEDNKSIETIDNNEIALDKVETANVDAKSVTIAKSTNSKSKKPNTKKTEPLTAEKEKSSTKSVKSKGSSTKEKTITSSKNESKPNSKDKKALASSKDDKTKAAQKGTKPAPKTTTKGKTTDKNTKAKVTDKNEKPTTQGKNTKNTDAQKSKTSNSKSKPTKPDAKKTDTKASGSKTTNKKSANSPDWVVPNKKKK